MTRSSITPETLDIAVAEMVADTNSLAEEIAAGQLPLTAAERAVLGRPRRNAHVAVARLAELAGQHRLDVDAVAMKKMLADMAYAHGLRPLARSSASFATLVGDLVLRAESASWTTATAIHAMLEQLAARDEQLAAELAGLAGFFAARRPARPRPARAAETRA